MTTTKSVGKMVEVHFMLGKIEYVTHLPESRVHTRETLQIAFIDRSAQAFKIRDVVANGSINITLDPIQEVGMLGSCCPLALRVN